MKKIKFGDLIRDRRRESGKSIDDIAQHMGWSKSYLMNIELARSAPPTVDKIIRLVKYLGNVELSQVLDTLESKKRTIKIDLDNINDDFKEIFIVLYQNYQDYEEYDSIKQQKLDEVKRAVRKLEGV
ncbi:helix-turn-helix domain-containing protein [Leptospira levettii]|uniref:helix-turn-helix domain-containing protein n=1 Tax=Leptospira levettii TaxID=2023178 RepID=UPI00223E4A75|nr:helix-turn-helix transcriptional regulator [Leptospira levettii]MCW7467549.1 helix-turn-helix domain-containing protein [Leptospira levettii]